MGCSIFNPVLRKHLVIGQRKKASDVSVFHWSTHHNPVKIGQHIVTTREVYLPKKTETSFITESDQAVRAVHSCNSWLKSRSVSDLMKLQGTAVREIIIL